MPSVIDNSIDSAIPLLGLLDELLNGDRISEITRHGQRVQFGGKLTQLRAACEESKVVPAVCEETGAGRAHTLARGRDDSYLCRRHGRNLGAVRASNEKEISHGRVSRQSH